MQPIYFVKFSPEAFEYPRLAFLEVMDIQCTAFFTIAFPPCVGIGHFSVEIEFNLNVGKSLSLLLII